MKEAMTLSDNIQSLIRRAQAGDRAAFDALVEGHREALERLIRTRLAGIGLKHTVGEEDILQETLLRAFRKLADFQWQGEDSFARWIGVIATNLIRSAGRREKRSPLPLLDPDACIHHDNSPSENARRGERFDRLQQALDSLDPDLRRVLVLVRIKGLPIKEVARELGRSPNAVSILLYRAALKLKESFGDTESLSLPWRQLEDRGGDHEQS
jgi:RNA polymerase sigma-70 factor (ECF subfamily)